MFFEENRQHLDYYILEALLLASNSALAWSQLSPPYTQPSFPCAEIMMAIPAAPMPPQNYKRTITLCLLHSNTLDLMQMLILNI